MALSDEDRANVERGVAQGILAIHKRHRRLGSQDEVCQWCLSPWPCRQAQWAHDVRTYP